MLQSPDQLLGPLPKVAPGFSSNGISNSISGGVSNRASVGRSSATGGRGGIRTPPARQGQRGGRKRHDFEVWRSGWSVIAWLERSLR